MSRTRWHSVTPIRKPSQRHISFTQTPERSQSLNLTSTQRNDSFQGNRFEGGLPEQSRIESYGVLSTASSDSTVSSWGGMSQRKTDGTQTSQIIAGGSDDASIQGRLVRVILGEQDGSLKTVKGTDVQVTPRGQAVEVNDVQVTVTRRETNGPPQNADNDGAVMSTKPSIRAEASKKFAGLRGWFGKLLNRRPQSRQQGDTPLLAGTDGAVQATLLQRIAESKFVLNGRDAFNGVARRLRRSGNSGEATEKTVEDRVRQQARDRRVLQSETTQAERSLRKAQKTARRDAKAAELQTKIATRKAKIDAAYAEQDWIIRELDTKLASIRDVNTVDALTKRQNLLARKLVVMDETDRLLSDIDRSFSGPGRLERIRDRFSKWRSSVAHRQKSKPAKSDTVEADRAATTESIEVERKAAMSEVQSAIDDAAGSADKMSVASKIARGTAIATVLLGGGLLIAAAVVDNSNQSGGEEDEDTVKESRDEIQEMVVGGVDPSKLSDAHLFKLFYSMKPEEFEAFLAANGLTPEEFAEILDAMEAAELSDDDDEEEIRGGFEGFVDYLADLLARFIAWLESLLDRLFGRLGNE